MFELMMYTGFAIMLYCWIRQPQMLYINWGKVAKFCGLMVLLSAVRFAVMENTPAPTGFMPGFARIPLVGWENCFFVFPIVFIKDYMKLSKGLWIPFVIALSLLFASGHVYQGVPAALFIGLVPYFIWYRYGKKHGHGSMIVMHIIYDFITILTLKLSILFNHFHI